MDRCHCDLSHSTGAVSKLSILFILGRGVLLLAHHFDPRFQELGRLRALYDNYPFYGRFFFSVCTPRLGHKEKNVYAEEKLLQIKCVAIFNNLIFPSGVSQNLQRFN